MNKHANINSLFKLRIQEVQTNLHDSNNTYNEICSEIQLIKAKLMEKASKEIEILLSDYDELTCIRINILKEKLYTQGFEDGIIKNKRGNINVIY